MGSTNRRLYEINPTLNIDGLPIRNGMKKCLHYMRYRYCVFGVNCAYHHPNTSYNPNPRPRPRRMPMPRPRPAAAASASTSASASAPAPASSSQGTHPTGEISMRNPGPWISYPTYYNPYFYNVVNNNPNRLPQWIPFQAPSYIYGQNVMPVPIQNHVANGADNMMPVQTPMVDDFSENSDEYICVNMLRTGNCRFGSECHFLHPNDWVIRRSECPLTDKGLTLRPEKQVCRYYASFGLCKSGPSCLFHHPIDFWFKEDESSSSMTEQGVKGSEEIAMSGSWLSICFPGYKS